MADIDHVLDEYKCPICLDVYEDPVEIAKCHHVLCRSCLAQQTTFSKGKNDASSKCVVCRNDYQKSDITSISRTLKNQLSSKSNAVKCSCGENILLKNFRHHSRNCDSFQKKEHDVVSKARFKPIAESSQNPANGPNRSTFDCPLCSATHLDCEDFVKHVQERNHTQRAVCPVCTAMPWGDPNYRTANLRDHVTRRHRFEYQTYVDYNASEEDVLQKVLAASLQEQ